MLTVLFIFIFAVVLVAATSLYSVIAENSLYQEGLKLFESGNRLAAKDKFNDLLKRNPKHILGRWSLARVYEEEFDRPMVIDHLDYMLSNNLFSSQVTEKNIRLHLADSYNKSGLVDRALIEYNNLLEKFPKDIETLTKQGELFYEKDDVQSALQVYRIITELDKGNFQAFLMCGKIHISLNLKDDAISYLNRALELDPANLDILYLLADIYEDKFEYKKARDFYKTILGMRDNPSPMVLLKISICDFKLKEYSESINKLMDLLTVDYQEDEKSLQREVLYYLVQNHLATNNTSHASRYLEDLYELDHNFKDVPDLMKKVTGMLSDEEIVARIENLHIYDFQEKTKRVIGLMGYDIVHSELIDDTSINYSVVDSETRKKRVIIFARKWTGQIGQFPLNELYLAVTREKAVKGIFLAPGTFKSEATRFRELNKNIDLVGQRQFCSFYRRTHYD